MAKIGRKLSELELLEGSGGGGGGGGGGSRSYFDAIKKSKQPDDKKALEDVQLGLGAAGVAAGVAAATDTPRKSTPEQRSNAKEKADRKNIPSFAETPSGYKKGGSVSSRADGIAQRGKTRGRVC